MQCGDVPCLRGARVLRVQDHDALGGLKIVLTELLLLLPPPPPLPLLPLLKEGAGGVEGRTKEAQNRTWTCCPAASRTAEEKEEKEEARAKIGGRTR